MFICGYIGDYSHLKRTSLDLNDKKFTNLSLAAPRKLLTEKHTAKLIQCGRSHCVIFGEKIGDTVYTHRESESEAEDTRAYFNFNRLKCTRIMLDDEEPSID